MADGNRNPRKSKLAEAIQGAKGGGSSSRKPVEAPDSLISDASAHILDLISEGEIAGFVSENPLEDVFLDETPVANADGSLNFTDVFMDWRPGTQDQPYMKGFPSVENEIAVGVELTDSVAWTRSISNLQLSAIRIRMSVPAFSKTNTENGDISGYRVNYEIDIAVDGGAFTTVLRNAFTGKTSSKYERSHRIDLPPASSGWIVRVRRLTPNSSETYIQDTTAIESIVEVLDVKMRYPLSAYVGLKINATQFRSIPVRAYRMLGRIIKIPVNYDPFTRTYSGVWNGAFKLGWTNNPAWIWYDLVTNARYGTGEYVDASMVDKWALYQIGQYCDQLVPDGKGGQEPRFTCTVFLQRQQEAYSVIEQLATVFRGISYWGTGAIIPVGDMPRDPVYTYTNANVLEGKFSYQGSSRRARHSVALVSWNDPNDFGRQKVAYVQLDEAVQRYGIRKKDVTAIGCMSEGQAQRFGHWTLLTEFYETNTVSFRVGPEGTLSLPGQVVRIADRRRSGKRIGGRIRSATSAQVTLDAIPNGVVPGNTLTVVNPATGATVTRPISAIDEGANIITISPSFPNAPRAHTVWAIESDTLPAQLFRIISVSEGENLSAVISALQFEPGKFAAVDTGARIDTQFPRPDVIGTVQQPPSEVTLHAVETATQTLAALKIVARWPRPPGATSYAVEWRRDDGEWSSPQVVMGNETELVNTFPGKYICKVIAINGLGIQSIPRVSDTFQVDDQTLTPGYVDDINDSIGEVIDSVAQEVQTRTEGNAQLAQEIANEAAARAQALADEAAARAAEIAAEIADEAAARAAGDLATAQAAADALLTAQLTLEAAITNESTIRQSTDESLATQISTMSAGTGEQFDPVKIWHFGSNVEGWTGSSPAPTSVNGWIRPGDGSNPYLVSPTGLAVEGGSYNYAKMRIRRVGTPTWEGRFWWRRVGDTTGSMQWPDAITQGRYFDIAEPVFDSNGVATIDFRDVPFGDAVIDQVRVDVCTSQDVAGGNYWEVDWIALGRPSPGASAAALQEERTARIAGDAAEATQRTTLAAQMRGSYTGNDLSEVTNGLVYQERQARVTADSAMASDITALDTRLDTAEGTISAQASAVSSLTTRVSAAEDSIDSQSDSITSLTSRIGAAEGVNTSQATALTNLTTRVTAAEGVNTTQAASITNLTSRIGAAEGVNTTQSTAISGLTTRVTDAEGDIDAQATQITNLTTVVNSKASTSALNALTTRVTTAEGAITAQTNDITSLSSSINGVAPNLHPNPSGETGVATDWIATGGSIDITDVGTGRRFRVAVAGTGGSRVVGPLIAVYPNRDYVLGMTFNRSSGGAGNTLRMSIYWYDSSGTYLGGTPVAWVPAGTTWTRFFSTGTSPAGAASARVNLQREDGGGSAETYYFNMIKLEQSSYPTVFTSEAQTTATSDAITSLDTRVTETEDSITSQSSSITSLTSRIGAAEGVNSAQGTAISGLTTRVGSAEGTISAQSTAIGQLTASVGDAQGSITSLQQVTASAQANYLIVPNPGFESNFGWGAFNATGAIDDSSLVAESAYVGTTPHGGSRVMRFGLGATGVTSSRYNSTKNIPLVDPSQRIRLVAWTRLTQSPTSGTGHIRLWVGFYDSSGTYISDNRTDYTASNHGWTRRLTDWFAPPAGSASCRVAVGITGARAPMYLYVDDLLLESETPLVETVNAKVGLYLDVNDNISGFETTNDGVKSEFNILADVFRVIGAGAEGMEWQNGYLRVFGAGYQRILGYNFGATGQNLVDYFGPNVGAAAASKTNATMWMDKNGNAYWGGSLSAGTLKNGMRSTSIGTVGLEITNGPFGTNGNVRTVTISYARSHNRTGNTISGASGYSVGAGTNTARIRVYRKIGTAAETLWQTLNVPGDVSIVNETDGPDVAILSWNGSMTVSDTSSAAQTVTYRAIMDQFTQQTVNYSGTSEQQAVITSDLTIVSVEQ